MHLLLIIAVLMIQMTQLTAGKRTSFLQVITCPTGFSEVPVCLVELVGMKHFGVSKMSLASTCTC